MSSNTIVLCVHADVKPWECVYVVGNTVDLGKWDPHNALPLRRPIDESKIWRSRPIELNSVEIVEYRYFVCYFLDSNTNGADERQMIIARWESILKPRQIYSTSESTRYDTFGSYDDQSLVNDGWLLDVRQTEIRLRLYDKAVKFYKPRHWDRVYRIKVTPIDVRFAEVYNYEQRVNDDLQNIAGSLRAWRTLSLVDSSVSH